MRRLVVVACALGLLLVPPASASAAEIIDVPATPVFRAGNNGPANCTAFIFVQWPAQENAQAWELDYEYLKGTAGILTHQKKTLKPPFSDEPTGIWEWTPPAGTHWQYHTSRSKSAPGDTVECASLQAEMLGRVISATVHVSVPDRPEEEEKEKEAEEEEKRKKEEEEAVSRPSSDPEGPPAKAGKATCRGKAATIVVRPGSPITGTSHRDVIVGTSKRDVIRALGGNDLVCGLGGNDLIDGGRGRDVLLGQAGRDTLHGRGGGDLLYGGGGGDHLLGQGAADRLFGQAGADALSGGAGRPDLCNGGPGRDQPSSPGCERRQQIP